MLGERLREHGVEVWLVNTGWSGGGYGTGARIELSYTRAMVQAALNGALAEAEFVPDHVFGVDVPTAVPGVPADLLRPRDTWSDRDAYDAAATQLAEMFRKNFERFAAQVPEEVRSSGPR
jgi:phosphoenolpyruvate carboxykinase (ATP)